MEAEAELCALKIYLLAPAMTRVPPKTAETIMEAPPLERKLVAILAADVASYSRMMGLDEEGTLTTLSAFRAVTDMLICKHGGRICGTAGDSVLAEFASVLAAVQCAVEVQRDLACANEELAQERQMWFRIGINVGDVMVKDGDIFGDGVNIAARIEGLAEPGGICISRGVHDHVLRKTSFRFEDLGEKSVKNIAQPIRVFRLIFDPNASEAVDIEKERLEAAPSQGVSPVTLPPDLIAPPLVEPRSAELIFWESVKDSARAGDYEAYIAQFPAGIFVALARARLEDMSSSDNVTRAPQDEKVELLFWESVRNSDNPLSFQAYIDKFPDGEFKLLAEIRLSELGAVHN